MSGRLTVRDRAARPLSILGPTASGKSSLALGIVEVLASQGQVAELVSIDSMQVYVGMDVGTATPTLEEQAAAEPATLLTPEQARPLFKALAIFNGGLIGLILLYLRIWRKHTLKKYPPPSEPMNFNNFL